MTENSRNKFLLSIKVKKLPKEDSGNTDNQRDAV